MISARIEDGAVSNFAPSSRTRRSSITSRRSPQETSPLPGRGSGSSTGISSSEPADAAYDASSPPSSSNSGANWVAETRSQERSVPFTATDWAESSSSSSTNWLRNSVSSIFPARTEFQELHLLRAPAPFAFVGVAFRFGASRPQGVAHGIET